jgi:hypothetical protein
MSRDLKPTAQSATRCWDDTSADTHFRSRHPRGVTSTRQPVRGFYWQLLGLELIRVSAVTLLHPLVPWNEALHLSARFARPRLTPVRYAACPLHLGTA